MTENFDRFKMRFAPGALNFRSVRVRVTPDVPSKSPISAKTVWDNPTLSVRHQAPIMNKGEGKRYSPLGRCVYCGVTQALLGPKNKLSDEHIVPYGLGGRWILPQSSCEACAKNTGRFEGKVLRHTLWAARAQVGIKGRTTQGNYPLMCSTDGNDVIVDLPLAEHPTILLLCNFKPPRLLKQRAMADDSVAGFWVHTFGDPRTALGVGGPTFVSPSFDTVEFSQMLAKIAHCYAVAAVGMEFQPMLEGFIRRKFPIAGVFAELFDLVGGDETYYAPGVDLHMLGHDVYGVDGRRYLVVTVRLFASLGGPVYRVVVGEV